MHERTIRNAFVLRMRAKKKIFNALNFIQQMLQIHYNPSVYIRKQMNNKDKMQLYIIQLIAI